MIITFDDGWKENYYLLDLIIKYKFKPTIFLTSHLINTQRNFWWTSLKTKDKEHFKKLRNNQRLLELKEKFDFYQEKEFPGNRQVLNLLEIDLKNKYGFKDVRDWKIDFAKTDLKKNPDVQGRRSCFSRNVNSLRGFVR